MGRKRHSVASIAALAIAGISAASGEIPAERTMAAREIRAGMRGTALTVFRGAEPTGFSVEFLGVLEKSRPHGDLILFRALGDSLERAGIAAGMSGSPVYADGRLVGAIAFAYPFSREPIGLITPIAEMQEPLRRIDQPPGPWMGPVAQPHAEWLAAFLDPRAARPAYGVRDPLDGGASVGRSLLCLQAAGWDPDVLARIDAFAGAAGLPRPVVAGGSHRADPGGAGLGPGSALGVLLVDGDASLGAIGTLTHRDGEKILAFGHPLFQGGPVDLPVTSATIHEVLPSYAAPFKVGSHGPVIGTLRQDLQGGVAGVLGEMPRMLPARVRIQNPSGSAGYRYRLARGLLLEPALLSWAAANSFLQGGWRVGHAAIESRLVLHFNGGERLERRERIASRVPAGDIAERLLVPVPLLLTNPHEKVVLDSVALEIAYEPVLRETRLVELYADRATIRPGETIAVTARLEELQGGSRAIVETIRVPERWKGRALLIVAGEASEIAGWDQERAAAAYQPRDLRSLVALIESFPSDGDFLLRVYDDREGILLGDREVGRLPASARRVLARESGQGLVSGSKGTLLDARRIDLDARVAGAALVRVRVE